MALDGDVILQISKNAASDPGYEMLHPWYRRLHKFNGVCQVHDSKLLVLYSLKTLMDLVQRV